MKRLEDLLISLYRLHLSLYPRAYREAFGEESLDVFSLAVQDARQRGLMTLFGFILRELRDLPVTAISRHLRERKQGIMASPLTHETHISDGQPASWLGALAGTWPFVFGPMNVILFYLPAPLVNIGNMPMTLIQLFTRLWLVTIVIGLVVGWHRGWPRWSLPYLGILLGIATVTLGRGLSNIPFFHSIWIQLTFASLIFLFLVSVFTLIARFPPSMHALYRKIRLDWTYLSFALYVTTLLLAGIDSGIDPVLTLNVFLPSVFILAGAFIHLRSKTKTLRFLALFGAIILIVFLRAAAGEYFFVYIGSFAVALIIAPAWLMFLPPYKQSAPNNS